MYMSKHMPEVGFGQYKECQKGGKRISQCNLLLAMSLSAVIFGFSVDDTSTDSPVY